VVAVSDVDPDRVTGLAAAFNAIGTMPDELALIAAKASMP
jgi:hypothetical protein